MSNEQDKATTGSASDEVRAALQFIHDTFKRDLDAGYRTRDKEFAVEIAAAALARAPLPAQGGAQEPKPVAWMDPTAGCVMDAFLWQRDPTNPQYCVPVYEAPAQADDARDAARYRWIAARFTGYDFYWGGTAPYEDEDDKGKCVIVFEVGQDFNAGRDFEAGIDASIAASLAGKDKP